MTTEAKRKAIDRADFYAQKHLGDYNELEEAGKAGTKRALETYDKAQFWLDRLNKLLGND